jgi:hypothetical protein
MDSRLGVTSLLRRNTLVVVWDAEYLEIVRQRLDLLLGILPHDWLAALTARDQITARRCRAVGSPSRKWPAA